MKVYLYNFYRGKLYEYEGDLQVRGKYKAIFRIINDDGKILRVLTCDPKPGVLYNHNVWFPEADKLKAINIFMEDENEMINKLKEALQRRKTTFTNLLKMQLIEEGISNGNVLRLIISSLIMSGEGFIMNYMGYSIVNWEYWAILILTLCYMLVYVFIK